MAVVRYLSGFWSSTDIGKYQGKIVGVFGLPAHDLEPIRVTRVKEDPRRSGLERPMNKQELVEIREYMDRVYEKIGRVRPFRMSRKTVTCPGSRACFNRKNRKDRGCFARQGNYLNMSTQKKRMAQFAFTLSPDFVDTMVWEINEARHWRDMPDGTKHEQKGFDTYRIHDSGDFYDEAYRDKWFAICERSPNTRFWCYTKSVWMFKKSAKEWLPKPGNLRVILSVGGTYDSWIDPVRDPHSFIFPNHEDLYAKGYADATGNDADVVFDSHLIGLVYHGSDKLARTILRDSKKAQRHGHQVMVRESMKYRADPRFQAGRMKSGLLPSAYPLHRTAVGENPRSRVPKTYAVKEVWRSTKSYAAKAGIPTSKAHRGELAESLRKRISFLRRYPSTEHPMSHYKRKLSLRARGGRPQYAPSTWNRE